MSSEKQVVDRGDGYKVVEKPVKSKGEVVGRVKVLEVDAENALETLATLVNDGRLTEADVADAFNRGHDLAQRPAARGPAELSMTMKAQILDTYVLQTGDKPDGYTDAKVRFMTKPKECRRALAEVFDRTPAVRQWWEEQGG
jgi:hypothetical protein